MQATRFMRKPFYATGIEVTDQNMDAVARWCQGHVIRDGAQPFIRVPVNRPTHSRQTEAYVGTWVLATMQRGAISFKVYAREWLDKSFLDVNSDFDIDELEIPVTATLHRGVLNFRVFIREWLNRNFFRLSDGDSGLIDLEIPDYPPLSTATDGGAAFPSSNNPVVSQYQSPSS